MNSKEPVSDAEMSSALMWHLTRKIGQAIIDAMTDTSIGEPKKQEGMMFYDPEVSANQMKLTGDFILSGTEGKFRK